MEQVAELIRACVDPDSEKRPTMKEVTERLREITKMLPEFAVPKLSLLHFGELILRFLLHKHVQRILF